MNKGFTMAELLIVVVLAGVLTLIALPKYQTAIERTRALEAIENICMLDEYYHIHKVIDDGFTMSASDLQDKIQSKYFDLSGSNGSFTAVRKSNSGWNYEITTSGCQDVGSGTDCARLDLPTFNCTYTEGTYDAW